MSDARVYLDWNATAPLREAARSALVDALSSAANPSSVHAEGRAARAIVERARKAVAALGGVSLSGAAPARVVLTSGASEAASLVLSPAFFVGRAPHGIAHLFVSAVEHPCVLGGGRFAERDVTRLPVDASGRIDLASLETGLATHDAISGRAMVALQMVNNETGVIQPVREAADIARRHSALVVVDAVQAAGRMALSMADLGADFLILSSHKIGGPPGAGALVCAGETTMPAPLVTGGGQEKGHRAGTENLPAIAGFGVAATEVAAEAESYSERVGPRRARLETAMRERASGLVIHGESAARVANTSLFSIPGLKAETAQIGFDLDGIALSAGSACSSGKVGRSHVLDAMGVDGAEGGLRVSLGPSTSDRDIDRFLEVFDRIVARRTVSRRKTEPA